MHILRLKVNDHIYDKLIDLLNKFSKDEVEVLSDDTFLKNQKYLESELRDIMDGKAEFLSFEETEERLNLILKKHENRL